MLTPGESPQSLTISEHSSILVVLGGQTRKLFMEGESAAGPMEEWRPLLKEYLMRPGTQTQDPQVLSWRG